MTSITTCQRCGYELPEPKAGAACPLCGGETSTSVWVTVTSPARAVASGGTALIYWYADDYAKAWYEDALREARTGLMGDRHARRREIVFAVCCAESYLYEWAFAQVRAMSSGNDLEANVMRFLPKSDLELDVTQRWVVLTRRLFVEGNGCLPRQPTFSGRHGPRWDRLLAFRNDVVHANISQPVFGSGPVPDPRTTNTDLTKLAPGWAVEVVAERIRRLHSAAGTAAPEWLSSP